MEEGYHWSRRWEIHGASGSMRLRGVIQLASMCEGTVAESSWGLAGVYLAVLRGVQ